MLQVSRYTQGEGTLAKIWIGELVSAVPLTVKPAAPVALIQKPATGVVIAGTDGVTGMLTVIAPLQLVDPRFYHLDTCFSPLPGGRLLYYPAAFDERSRRLILDHYDWDACLSGFDDLMRPASMASSRAAALTGAGS